MKMVKIAAILMLAVAVWAAPVAAQPLTGTPRVQRVSPAVIEALAAIRARALVGIFRFVAPSEAPTALADYLLRDHAKLKRFVKKLEKDLKKFRAISRWDKYVCLHMVGLGLNRSSPGTGKMLSKKWIARVQELTLVPSLPHRELAMRRGGK